MNSKTLSSLSFALALLLLMVLSFGLLIPWLGFFWDDWPTIMVARLQGIRGFLEFHQLDRPYSAWIYMSTVPLLGVRPLAWHLAVLLLRWLTALVLWWSLRLLWPNRGQEAAWVVVLFTIYPIFDLQPIAVTFVPHWITYLLFFASIIAMLLSQRRPQRRTLYLAIGLLTQAAHLVTFEYFTALELLRPYLLWIVLSDPAGLGRHLETRPRLLLVLRHWSPYLLVLAAYLVYRFTFFQLASEDAAELALANTLLRQPLSGLAQLLGLVVPDLLHTLFGTWSLILDPANFDLSQPINLFSLAISALVAMLTTLYLRRSAGADGQPDGGWTRQAFILGMVVLLLGPLPVWMIGKQAVGGLYNSRFALGALLGAGLLVVAFLEWLQAGRTQKIILVAVLAGLAAGQHLRTANDYRWSWTKQTQFYWQLHWRAPELQPGTMILSEGEIFPYVGINSTSAAINLLYPSPGGTTDMRYWFSDLHREFGLRNAPDLDDGLPVERQVRSYWFHGSSLDSVAIYYQPGGGRCLWVPSPDDGENPDLPEILQKALPATDLARIGAQDSPGYPPEAIFGPEPAHDWCYLYQKAELGRQMGDWETVVGLAEEAQAKGFAPNNPHEWLPFIEAYAQTGHWSQALDRSLGAWRADRDVAPRLCRLWERVEAGSQIPATRQADLSQLKARLDCDRY